MLVFSRAPVRVSLASGDENDRHDGTPAGTTAAVQESFYSWQDQLDSGLGGLVEQAVTTGQTSSLLNAAAWDLAWQSVNGKWDKSLTSLVAKTGQKEINRLGFDLSFTTENPYATQWSKTQSAQRVTQVTVETKAAIQNAVGLAFESHLPPKQLAPIVQQSIGLRDRDAQAVVNRALQRLTDGDSDAVVQRDAERYANRLLKGRALLIARTETVDAQNKGLQASWQEARDKRLIGSETKRVWLAAGSDRTCPICSDFGAAANRETPLDRPYVSTSHGESNGPTAHPGCRCTQGLKTRTA